MEISLIAGGPPCQPFSKAGRHKIRSLVREGKRPEHDIRIDLWQNFLNFVDRFKPRSVAIENVPDLGLGRNQGVFRKLVLGLDDLGYKVQPRILPAWEHGVPQHRRRLFIVGFRGNELFEWPAQTKPKVTVADAISDLPIIRGGVFRRVRPYRGPRTDFQRDARSQVDDEDLDKIYDLLARAVRKDDLQAFKELKVNMRYRDLPDSLKRYRSDTFSDKYNRLPWDDLSRTITAHIAKDGYWYIHPRQQRTISVREATRLQTFPDNFRFAGFRSNAFRQIGEAVPPSLGEALGTAILKAYKHANDNQQGPSISEISAKVNSWFENLREIDMATPWRKAKTIWQVYLGMTVLPGVRKEAKFEVWEDYCSRWPEPETYLADSARQDIVTANKMDRLSRLSKIAEALGPKSEQWHKINVPGVPANKQLLAHLLCGFDEEIPISEVPARVAKRIFGQYSNGRDKPGANGRVLLTSLLGRTGPGKTFAALLEIGDQFCIRINPKCNMCPVQSVCRTGSELPNTNGPEKVHFTPP